MKKHQSYSFEITHLSPAGKGQAVLDGIETTISHALPGQAVQARVFKKKARFGRCPYPGCAASPSR